MPELFAHIANSDARIRADILTNLDTKANDQARIAGIRVIDLEDYLKGLIDLGLLDSRKRITVDGVAYLAIARRRGDLASPYLDRTAIWRRVGGDETRLTQAINRLVDKNLVNQTEAKTFELVGAGAAA